MLIAYWLKTVLPGLSQSFSMCENNQIHTFSVYYNKQNYRQR